MYSCSSRVFSGTVSLRYFVEVDWLNASEDDRKRLYTATISISKALGMTVEEILDAALGRKFHMGTDYRSTFRRGKIRRSYAKLIYAWILDNHRGLAHKTDSSLFAALHTDAWDEYLIRHGTKGSLKVASRGKSELGLISKAKDRVTPDIVLNLGQDFCFHLNNIIDGFAVGFQRYKGQWYPMPWAEDDGFVIPLRPRVTHFPLTQTNDVNWLCEEQDRGAHRFAIAVSSDLDCLPTVDHPPLSDAKVSVHFIDVYFSD